MRVNKTGKVEGFLEKPQTVEELALVHTRSDWIDERGIESKGREYLASMGIYLFNRDTLVDILRSSNDQDFGKEVFPTAIRARKVQCHLFDGYWEDIGTIRAFYDANLALTKEDPPFDLTDDDAPIYSRARFLPPTHVDAVTIRGSLIADGCSIGAGTVIENSIIGLRCRIGKNVTIRDSILMGSDYFQSKEELTADLSQGVVPLGIGDGATIEGAIIDKNVRIGSSAHITPSSHTECDLQGTEVVIRDGIVVVARGTQLPRGWKAT
jgi:glucose-1-phosphate adenylyltransferase